MTPLYFERLALAVGAQHATAESGRSRARPGSAAEIADVLRVAREAGVTAGVGVAPLSLDLSRMKTVLHLDETSLLVTVQAGITAEELGALLQPRGLSLAPLPAISLSRTIGTLLSAPRPSEASPACGRFADSCAGLGAVLADGTEIATRIAPRKATGPDLMHALIGTRGTIGVITSATLRLARRGELREEAAWALPSLGQALACARAILVRGGRPHDLQVALSPAISSGITLSVAVEGPRLLVENQRQLCHRLALEHGGAPVPHTPPPLQTTPCEEKWFPLSALPSSLPPSARVIGWHIKGAAAVDPERAPGPTSAAHPLLTLLKRRLDADGRLPPWPGA